MFFQLHISSLVLFAKKEIASTETEPVNYTINSVQIKILGSYNIIKHFQEEYNG